jgi:hypothetical protein
MSLIRFVQGRCLRFSRLAHLGKDHGRNLFRRERLLLALEFYRNDRLAPLVDDLEGEVPNEVSLSNAVSLPELLLHVRLDLSICELAADEALCVEHSVDWIHGD